MTFDEFVAEWNRQELQAGLDSATLEARDMAEEAWQQATKTELDRCIGILMKLHEESQGFYNYYLYAAEKLRGIE